jgi:protein-tyrosine kinase
MEQQPGHLIERAARRLSEQGLAGPELVITPGEAAATPPDAQQPTLDIADADLLGVPPPPAAENTIDMATLERVGLIGRGERRDRISEEFRVVQGQVLRIIRAAEQARQPNARLLMVTSARPHEGKSFTALNLASSLARYGERTVLLVDVDVKNGSLTDLLGLTNRPGVLDLVLDPAPDPARVTIGTAIPRFSVVPVGGHLTDRQELSAKISLVSTLHKLGAFFSDRIVVLDAPPCLSSSEPSTLAPLLGQTIFVVEAERTQRNEVEAALDLIEACPTVTLLLNKIQLTTNHTFGAYGAYA